MKTMRNILVLLALLVSVNIVAKPKIRIIATGGTIAGVSASATSSAYSDQLGGEQRVFLDPNKLSDDGTVALKAVRFSKNSSH